jgi:hypothetical protein
MNNLAIANISSSTFQSDLRLGSNDTVKEFLDAQFPLNEGSHRDVTQYCVYYKGLVAHLKTGRCVALANPGQFTDYGGEKGCPTSIVFCNAEQQIELQL